MKKLLSLMLALMLLLSLAACGSGNTSAAGSDEGDSAGQSEESQPEETAQAGEEAQPEEGGQEEAAEEDSAEPESITVTGLNGSGEEVEVTVPYNPQRVVVVDFANLDILDNLGLGDRVVGVPTITLDYLKAYGEDENIAIVGTVKTPDLEAVMACEPDVIFMSGRGAEYYDSLCEIAPVVRLISDSTIGLVETVRKNATTIASIFGEEDQVNALLEQYDARIAALAEFAEGKTAVLGMCTTGSFNLLGNDGRCSLIVNEIGFDNIGADAATVGGDSGRSGGRGGSSDSGESGSGHGGRGESAESTGGATPTHGNEVSFELIVDLNPEYIFVMDRDAAIGTEGAQLAQEIMENELIMKTDAYQNGNLVILEHPGIWYTGEGGITALGIMLEDLEAALLQ